MKHSFGKIIAALLIVCSTFMLCGCLFPLPNYDSEMPAIGVGGDMASPPEARGDEAHTPGNVSETQAGSGADRQVNVSTPESEKPADVYNEIADGQLPNDNEDVPQEREMIAKRENVHYPTWIMDNVIQVSSGDYHTMVIKEGGSLWGWGWNINGQLGIDTNQADPTQ